MILLEISADWYWFLVFGGGFLIISTIVLLVERRSEDEEILHLNPLIVIRNILVLQITFYLLYLFINFTINVAGFEVFWPQQVFSFVDIAFFSRRGLMNGMSLILTYVAMAIPMAAVVPTFRHMVDYGFTIFVLHFIVVSIVEKDFPVNGAWWTAIGAGFILCWFLAERLSYALATMTYMSHLGGAKAKPKTEVELTESKSKKVSTEQIEVKVEIVDNTATEEASSPVESPTRKHRRKKNKKIKSRN